MKLVLVKMGKKGKELNPEVKKLAVDLCQQDKNIKQEAHGPRFAHLSDIATADMQMLCNIFPILSSQLMKISSFEQFLVLEKNIWGLTVNGA